MTAARHCPTCGAKTVEYRHSLSRSMARILIKITAHMDENRRFHVSECELTNSQINNLQKLRYWDMIEKCEDATRKGGWWQLTWHGGMFVIGRHVAYSHVRTYRGERTEYLGRVVTFGELTGGWLYRPQYAQEALPFAPGGRP